MLLGSRSGSQPCDSIQGKDVSHPLLVIYIKLSVLLSLFCSLHLNDIYVDQGLAKFQGRFITSISLSQTRGKHAWGNPARHSPSQRAKDTAITASQFSVSEDSSPAKSRNHQELGSGKCCFAEDAITLPLWPYYVSLSARWSNTDASRSEDKVVDHFSDILVNVTQKCSALQGTKVLLETHGTQLYTSFQHQSTFRKLVSGYLTLFRHTRTFSVL